MNYMEERFWNHSILTFRKIEGTKMEGKQISKIASLFITPSIHK